MQKKKKHVRNFLLSFCMLGSFLFETTITSQSLHPIPADDWMAEIDGKTKLSNIFLPGTHDSCTQFIGLSYVFRCQNSSIKAQLENGYRYLDIRLALDEDNTDKLILKHNFSKCRRSGSLFSSTLYLDHVVDDVYSFLNHHPSETVIMCMKNEEPKDDVSQVKKALFEVIEKKKESWYLSNRIPTMDEVRGKIVLATRIDDKKDDQDKGVQFFWDDQGDREVLSVPHKEHAITEKESVFVQDRYNYDVSDKIEAIRHGLSNCKASDESFYLNFASTSGKGKIGHPVKYAKTINDFLYNYNWKEKNCYGVVIVDYATRKLAEKIYRTN
ncbi:MAG: phosphatidylinositol-specific phospholipase C domain-containing protein [Bacilli bacterium]|nr:phosphatidylinositol-specific phospholipase C domain-containing protein [Bacilli bacterium]